MKILLVEDNQPLAQTTAKLIERLGGHQVLITVEPEEIFHQCEIGAVELVLMDINLPGVRWQGQKMDGTRLSYLLKTRWQQIPIIVITAYTMMSEQSLLLNQSHADCCYTKPITDYAALLDVITQLGQRSS